jgi:hypothetical protein
MMTVEAWAVWALLMVALLIAALLFEIRGKLEAIRFMMARYFDEKYAPRYDEDGDLSPPSG